MKIALCLSSNAARAQRICSDMIESQQHEPGCNSRLVPFPLGCVGLLGRPDESPDVWPFWRGTDGGFLAFAGLPLSTHGTLRGTDELVRGALAGDDASATSAELRALDGAFVGVWWNALRGELTVMTDFLGMQPLYRTDADGETRFASEAKAFVGSGVLPATPDAGAWGAMLYFGHQIGPRSLLSGAVRVPAASAIVFTQNGEQSRSTTWTWPASTGAQDTPALRDAIGDAVRADVTAYAAAYPRASILLSGGFDSRLILCLCNELGVKPHALIQSHPDENADADARFAAAFAKTIGVSWRRVPVHRDFFGTDDYLRFLERNEIATPSYRLFIPTVATAVEGLRSGVWEGLLLDPALKFDYGDGGFAPYLAARAKLRQDYRRAASLVFAPSWADRMTAEYEELLTAERTLFTDDAEGVWRFSVLNRSRFRTGVNPYQVYDVVTPALTPGMSKRFWETVADLDPRARFGKRLYRSVFEHLAPDGLRTPIASGASLIAGRGGARLYHTQRARAAAQRFTQRPKVNRLLRSAGLGGSFTWQQSRFLGLALDEAALDDGRLNADRLLELRRGERSGRGSGGGGGDAAIALEVLMYWQAWQHAMKGDLLSDWGAYSAAELK